MKKSYPAPIFVVVITYNGEKDIGAFLETYRKNTPDWAQLIIVDNASSDKTIDIAREQYAGATILQNTINHGFAGGARQGMEYALMHGAEYIAIVNQDLRFGEQWLLPLVDFLDTHGKCAAVQPRIMMYPETNVINSYGNAQHYLGFGYTLGYRKHARHSEQSEESRRHFPELSGLLDDSKLYPCEHCKELATCSGCATLFRGTSLSAVGLIDDAFFMYSEDSDLSWRLRLAGFTLSLCCESIVYHRYEFSRSIQKFYYMERNRFISTLSNYSMRTLFLIAPMLFIMEAGMLAYSIAGTLLGKRSTLTLKEKLRSYGYFFRPSSWRYIRAKRRVAQRLRKVSDKEIVRLFCDAIEFQDIDNCVLLHIANPLMHWYWQLAKRVIS